MQRTRRAFRDALSGRFAALAAVALLGCQSPPLTGEQIAALDYGPRPQNYEKIVRDYLNGRLNEPGFAVIEFRAGPSPLYQRESSRASASTAGRYASRSTSAIRAETTSST
jgi:hypothetical protein